MDAPSVDPRFRLLDHLPFYPLTETDIAYWSSYHYVRESTHLSNGSRTPGKIIVYAWINPSSPSSKLVTLRDMLDQLSYQAEMSLKLDGETDPIHCSAPFIPANKKVSGSGYMEIRLDPRVKKYWFRFVR